MVELQKASFLTAVAIVADERAASAVARDQLAPDDVANVFAPRRTCDLFYFCELRLVGFCCRRLRLAIPRHLSLLGFSLLGFSLLGFGLPGSRRLVMLAFRVGHNAVFR